MKGIAALFLGIFGTFAFSWVGMTLIPNYQIGHLDPQTDEEGADAYPVPKSGMAERGRQIYAANGCVYCHSQQVRADYASSDIERKWGVRRSAPRDYIFERPALLGKSRLGPDLSNIGKRAPSDDQNAPPPASTDPAATSPAPAPGASPAASPPATAAAPPATSPAASPAASPAISPAQALAANAPAPAATNATTAAVPPPPANSAATAATSADTTVGPSGAPIPYSAPWHHLHLYSPRSITLDSNMPAYHFLYEKRLVSGERSADALKLTGPDAPDDEWEIVPTYDAKCLVAYIMSLDQSHELKEAKSTTVAASAPASSPAPATSPEPAKEAK
jgi:cbb3-type cytochrome oxidase cytochrome c subunit